jgi:hypothetical protein
LIGLAEAADAGDRRHALLPGEKAAIRAATPTAAIDGAPSSIIDGQGAGGRLRQHRRRQHQRQKQDGSGTHRNSPLMVLQTITNQMQY